MAKKSRRKSNQAGSPGAPGQPRGAKSAAVRTYLVAHKGAMPKEVVAALKEKGVDVSPNLVSIIKAKAGIKKAKRKAKRATARHDATAAAQTNHAASLDAALTLYKTALGQETQPTRIRQAFLLLVETLG